MGSIHIKFIKHDELLKVLVSGLFNLQDAIDRFLEVLAFSHNAKIFKVLIDFRKLGGIPFATEKSLYAIKGVELYNQYLVSGGQPLKFAYIGSAPIVSSFKPGLEIARNSGIEVDLFEDIEKAFEWLDAKKISQSSTEK